MQQAEARMLLGSIRSLTKLGTTPDGGVIVGPQGWAEVQLQLFEHFRCSCCTRRLSRQDHFTNHVGCAECRQNTVELGGIVKEIERNT